MIIIHHFLKVKYGEFEANIRVSNGDILNGDLPISKLKLVKAWAEIHKSELQQMWDSKDFYKIQPLRENMNKITKIAIQESSKILCSFKNGENRLLDAA